MKINVKVIPNAKVEQIQTSLDGNIKIWTRAKPVDGEANKRILEALANHLGCKKYQIKIVSGLTSKNKVVEVEDH